jgi:hypothetical protein
LPDTRRPAGSSDVPFDRGVDGALRHGEDAAEDGALVADRFVHRIGKARPAAAGDRGADFDQSIGTLHAKLAQEQRVHETEDGGVRADAERERQHRREREDRVAPQQPRAIPHILNDRFHERTGARVANVLLHRIDAAELYGRGAPRLLGPHTRFHFLLGEQRVSRCQLLLEVAVHGIAMHEIAPETAEAGPAIHI